jgi:inorganic pyrophosphatase
MDLWQHADRMVGGGELVIDRPVGSAHPKVREFVYPLDYGYIAGTTGGDGECVDVWVGSGDRECVTAVACTIDPSRATPS